MDIIFDHSVAGVQQCVVALQYQCAIMVRCACAMLHGLSRLVARHLPGEYPSCMHRRMTSTLSVRPTGVRVATVASKCLTVVVSPCCVATGAGDEEAKCSDCR